MASRRFRTIAALALAGLLGRSARAFGRDLGDLLVERGVISKEDLEQLRREMQAEAARPSKKARAGATARTGASLQTAPPATLEAAEVPAAEHAAPAATGATGVSAAAAAPPTARVAPEDLNTLVKHEVQSQLPDWLRHFKLSTLIYMDWAYYLNSGYGPQFLTQITPPGPGNDGFNSFDLTRAYINLFWKPTDRFTIRVTPNVFREIDTSATTNTSKSSQVATNVNGNLTYRLKYAYLQVNDVFHGMNVRVGQIENPLIPWEEDLYGYRFVNLVPLNFLAYSSTDLGIAFHGPIAIDGVRWADYWLGAYNGSSFHTVEFNEKRSPQGRVSVYPLAANPTWKDLGLTYFMSYGYTNVPPDTEDSVIRRIAALAHYNGKYGGLAFEFDDTRGENSFANFFTGAAPPQTLPDPNDPTKTIPNPLAQLYTKILNPGARGRGYSVFGHLNIGDSPFSFFGMWQRWYPNLDVSNDPLDFDRIVFGLAWQAEPWLRLAVDSQNLMYVHSGPAVPQDTHAIFTNMEINY